MSIESRLHSVLKHGFGYDSGPRFNGTRHNAHREAMKPSLAGLSEAVQKRQARIEAGVNHREAMKPTLAGLSDAVQNRQAQRDANTHREGMKSIIGELKERRALKTIEHALAAKKGAEITERKIADRIQHNQTDAGKKEVSRDADTMRMISGGTSWRHGFSGAKISLLQQGRRLVGRFHQGTLNKWNEVESMRDEARKLKPLFTQNKDLNPEAQKRISKAEHREIGAVALDKSAAPVGAAVTHFGTPVAGILTTGAVKLAGAGALHTAANQRGFAADEFEKKSLDRDTGGEAFQKELSYMRGRGERKKEAQNRDEVVKKGFGAIFGTAADLVDQTGTVSKTVVDQAEKGLNKLVKDQTSKRAQKLGHDEHQTNLGLQNQIKTLRAASAYLKRSSSATNP
ncbi:MAG: hypothetical protein VW684_15620 [Betaproteobacteria bacterium]